MIVDSILCTLVNRIVDLHNCCLIATPVTIIWGRKDCNDLSIVLPLVALHDKLVCTRNEMKTINMSKLLRDILTERVTSSPR